MEKAHNSCVMVVANGLSMQNLERAYSSKLEFRKNQNLTIVCQNLTGMTYLQFFGLSTSSLPKSILETCKTSFLSNSLIQ